MQPYLLRFQRTIAVRIGKHFAVKRCLSQQRRIRRFRQIEIDRLSRPRIRHVDQSRIGRAEMVIVRVRQKHVPKRGHIHSALHHRGGKVRSAVDQVFGVEQEHTPKPPPIRPHSRIPADRTVTKRAGQYVCRGGSQKLHG